MKAKGREGEEKPIRGTERGTQRQEEDGEARGVLGKSGGKERKSQIHASESV